MKQKKIFGVRQVVENPEKVGQFFEELCARPPKNMEDLEKRKRAFSARTGISTILNRDLISVAEKSPSHSLFKKEGGSIPNSLMALLQKRAVRTISGVSPIGILTKPYPCPGRCVYCPTEARMPKSYLSSQPAAARAVRNNFHPFRQVASRIAALEDSGHPVSKLEVIVMGGTWSFLPHHYQSWYVKKIFDAANQTTNLKPQTKILIRDIQKKDWEEALKMEQVTLKNVGFEDSPQENDFGKYGKFCEKFLVGILDGKIVAMGGFRKKSSKVAEVKRFRVHPDFQNCGIGQQFFQHLLAEVEKRGFKKIVLDFSALLSPKNEYFYQKFGFHEVRREKEKKGERLFYEKDFAEKKFKEGKTLSESQRINETAERRVIGLTLETRPDFINERELVRMRKYGCTRIEIGVQTLDDDVQRLTKRGHDRRHVVRATKLMRDFGFKVCYHLMPGLPGSTPEKDLQWMKEVFENPDFCPDFVKIYPCVVLETAELKKWWEEGKYQPLRDDDLIKLLLKFKTFVPPWTRIMRLMRDIPASNILDGAKFSNLRQIMKSQPEKLREIMGEDFFKGSPQSPAKAEKDFVGRGGTDGISEVRRGGRSNEVRSDDWVCKCIRCREVGFAEIGSVHGAPVLTRRDYEASEGLETFLSFETEDKAHLFALLRLRKPSGQKFSQFKSVLHNAALIREVHSYGTEIVVGDSAGVGQHRGLGRRLIEEAEHIARDEWKLKRMTIIAGVGTREYYKKFGYELKSTYMTKKL